MRLYPLFPSLRIVLDLLKTGELLLLDLPHTCNDTSFDDAPKSYLPELRARLAAFQQNLVVRIAADESDDHIRDLADSVADLLKIFASRGSGKWRGYGSAYALFSRRMETFRATIDEELVSSYVKKELLSLLQDLSTATTSEPDPSESLFDEKLKLAAKFIQETAKPPKGVKGVVVAKHIEVSPTTLRRHYIPALKARFGVGNDGNGYYIRSAFALMSELEPGPADFNADIDASGGYFADDDGTF